MNPLAELKDIVLPEQIHNYPVAAGWWILLIVAVVSFIYAISLWKKRKLINVNKAKALAALTNLELSQESKLEQTVAILKWSALAYFPREQVANLYGKDLQAFLLSTLPAKFHDQFNSNVGESFDHIYSASNTKSAQEFNNAALVWVKHALPPKAQKDLNKTALGNEK